MIIREFFHKTTDIEAEVHRRIAELPGMLPIREKLSTGFFLSLFMNFSHTSPLVDDVLAEACAEYKNLNILVNLPDTSIAPSILRRALDSKTNQKTLKSFGVVCFDFYVCDNCSESVLDLSRKQLSFSAVDTVWNPIHICKQCKREFFVKCSTCKQLHPRASTLCPLFRHV